MSFNIPKKAWLSFSRKQTIDSLLRMAAQIEQGWEKLDYRNSELALLENYLENLELHHPSEKIQKIAQDIISKVPLNPNDPNSIQQFQMFLEREDKRDLKDEDFLISTQDSAQEKMAVEVPVVLVLDNLRSSFNVGSLFRSAESFGIKHIHLCGYTPTPENSKTARSSLGTENWIHWKYWESTFDCLNHLKNTGHTIYAFETEQKAIQLEKLSPQSPAVLLLGNERYGLSEEILKFADHTIQIKMSGRKNSLNVSVCGAIAMNYFSLRTAVSI